MQGADGFARFYEQESDAVLIFLVRRTLDAEVALELTAETFAIALDSWRTVAPLTPEQARAWVFTVARRRHSRYLRRARVERTVVERLGIQLPPVSAGDIEEIEERAGVSALRGVVARELRRLNLDTREAVRLRVVEEQSYSELASQLGITEATARARVSRGLRRLAAAVEPYRDLTTEAAR